MTKFQIALLALGAALATTPAAMADTFYFHYSSNQANASGMLTATESGNSGIYTVTAGTIDVGYNGGGTYMGTIDTNPADLAPYGADNLLYTLSNSPNGLLLDVGGLLFGPPNSYGLFLNLWGGDNNGNVNLALGTDNYSIVQSDWVDFPGTFSISTTPEPSSLLLLGTGLLGLAFLIFRRAKAPTSGLTPSI